MDAASVAPTVHLGELGLDGRLRPVPGVLPAVMAAARAGQRRVVVPHANAAEAELVEGIDVLGAVNLAEVAGGTARTSRSADSIRFPRPHPYGEQPRRCPISPTSSASARPSRRSSPPPRAAITC